MLLATSVFWIPLLFDYLALCACLPPLANIPQEENAIQFEPFQEDFESEDNEIDFAQLFSPDYWFPIEINVPDTIQSTWQGIQSTWTFVSETFENIQL